MSKPDIDSIAHLADAGRQPPKSVIRVRTAATRLQLKAFSASDRGHRRRVHPERRRRVNVGIGKVAGVHEVVVLIVNFAWTRELLSMFRPEFADEGLTALRLLSVATAFTVFLSLAPTHLKYMKRNRATYAAAAGAAAAQILLMCLVIPSLVGAD
jgi:hypothetical protein